MAELNRFWDQLLHLIEEGRVVPVVGQDLLTLPPQTPQTGHTHLYPYLAARLAEYLEVSSDNLPAGAELNEVATRFTEAGNAVQDVYAALKSVAAESETWAPPTPLRQLAEISPLSLFVTTTFDSSLARALNQTRFGGQERTRVFAHTPTDVEDVPGDVRSLGGPIVYHLMGKLSATPAYAVTQEDVIEVFCALQSETRRPAQLFHELSSRSLLLLGTRFSGWLTTFLMRMLKSQALSSDRKTDYVADDTVTQDQNLVLFLERTTGKKIKIVRRGDAVAFVNELHMHWKTRHPDGAPATAVDAPEGGDEPAKPGAVFLSYAKEDAAIVEALGAALDAAGVDVYFDRHQLQAGNEWDPKLKSAIRQCSLFIPVISRQTLTPDRRYFRLEWNLALEESLKILFSPDEAFLLPVVIDDTSITHPDLPAKFSAVQWQSLPGGIPTPAFVNRVKQLYREHQMRMAGAV